MNDIALNLNATERLEYFLSEAQRQLQQGAYRMAMTWAYHARQLAVDQPAFRDQADALFAAANHTS